METLMSEASQKSNPTTSVVTPNAISSLASEVGASPCSLPDGLQIALCGQEAVLASHSQQQEKDLEQQTSGISGPCSSISSASAALSMSLANRLQARLGTAGSMEYRQTWKQKATPAGRPYWAHTASALRISGNDYIGLPTISAREGKDWSRARILASLDTGTGVAKRICRLWLATHSPEMIVGLNHCFGAWMMGYPQEWSVATATAMQSFPKSRRSSSKRISKTSES